MPLVKSLIGASFLLAVVGATSAIAATDAAGNIQPPARPAFIENPNSKGVCLKIYVPGIRCPIPNPDLTNATVSPK